MKKKNAENCCFVGDKEVNFFLRSICFETAARLTRKSIIYLIKKNLKFSNSLLIYPKKTVQKFLPMSMEPLNKQKWQRPEWKQLWTFSKWLNEYFYSGWCLTAVYPTILFLFFNLFNLLFLHSQYLSFNAFTQRTLLMDECVSSAILIRK